MADVKVLIIGTSRGGWAKGKKGDIWAITPGDFGTAETAPDWVQLTVTDVPGATQAEAVATMHQYIKSVATGFQFSEVAGAGVGEQRYRVESRPEVGRLPNPIFLAVRNGVTARFAITGDHVGQSPGNWFEFDSSPGLPLDEIEYEATQAAEDSRRYQLSDNYVDNLLGGVAAGQPAEDSQTWAWLQSNVEDKLD
jgi:hypothetical protein